MDTTPAGPATTPAETTTVDFAITVRLGNPPQDVTISAPGLNEMATKGLYFSLPAGTIVTLGSLKDLITWLNTQLASAGVGVTIPTDASGWPTALADIFNGILNTVVSVKRFAVAQDPQVGGVYPPTRFDLEVTAVAMDPADTSKPKPIPIFGIFSVVGGGLGLTRTYAGAPNTWTPLSAGATQPALPPAPQT